MNFELAYTPEQQRFRERCKLSRIHRSEDIIEMLGYYALEETGQMNQE